MLILDPFRTPLVLAPADAAAGGGEGAAAAATTDPAAQTAAAAALAAGADGNAVAAAGAKARWWESPDYSDDERQWLTAKGLADEDVGRAVPKLVKGHRAAEQRIGRGLDSIMDRPKKDQDLTEWMRGQAEIFGLPENADGYKIERPEGMTDGALWDQGFEAEARKLAFDQGLTPKQLQALSGFYAGKIAGLEQAAEDQYKAANETMMKSLAADWGKETDAKLAQARLAAGVLAEKAGLDAAGLSAVAASLSKGSGDAATIRLFSALADMMGDDRLVRGGATTTLGTTPADARRRAAELRAPDGAYAKAVATNDRTELARLKPEIERLDRIAAGG